jgi:hypothetical protein
MTKKINIYNNRSKNNGSIGKKIELERAIETSKQDFE